ncbi:MAG: hypothetical protein Hyperionvirus2_218 [Hyperionvirus sp.]|uniref:Uncharacterized protein n=1 Tax=Hyperionvirus sp. TaxID=2487770 RepID=A0A3G5A6G1_9VIRU|nr:MAG: hypothetical protein Hyperionvirus2_218 [Hyperionvirus sp.]
MTSLKRAIRSSDSMCNIVNSLRHSGIYMLESTKYNGSSSSLRIIKLPVVG